MQTLAELAPLVAFFVTYRLRGLYAATAVLMVGMALLLLVDWLRERRFAPLHLLSALLVLIFGSATLLLHNRVFIQWKPTVMLWALSVAFLISAWVGSRTLTERFLGPAFQDRVALSAASWRQVNLGSVVFYALAGAANLAVARAASESTWVTFKVIGLPALAFLFTALQAWWLTRRGTAVHADATAGP